jgi:hypothetical protein
VTPIDIVDDHAPAEDRDDDGDGLTRVREIVSIDPDAAAFTRPSATTQRKGAAPELTDVPRFDPPERTDSVDEATQLRVPTASALPEADDRTIVRPPMVVAPHAAASAAPPPALPPAPADTGAPAPPRLRGGLWVGLAAAAVVVVVTLTIAGLNVLVAGIEAAPEATETSEPQDVVTDFVPKVLDLAGTRQGEQIVFTWVNRDPQEGDRFIWSVVDVSGQVDPQQSDEPVAQVAATPGIVCIDVMLRRDDGRVSEPVRGCVDG